MENKLYKIQTSNGRIISHNMTIAENILSRMKGLMFTSELPKCDGFLIKPCNSIHTFFMQYSLDVIFLDKNFKIVKIIYDLAPWRVTPIYFKSTQVLEMKAGTLIKDLSVGEQLEVVCLK